MKKIVLFTTMSLSFLVCPIAANAVATSVTYICSVSATARAVLNGTTEETYMSKDDSEFVLDVQHPARLISVSSEPGDCTITRNNGCEWTIMLENSLSSTAGKKGLFLTINSLGTGNSVRVDGPVNARSLGVMIDTKDTGFSVIANCKKK